MTRTSKNKEPFFPPLLQIHVAPFQIQELVQLPGTSTSAQSQTGPSHFTWWNDFHYHSSYHFHPSRILTLCRSPLAAGKAAIHGAHARCSRISRFEGNRWCPRREKGREGKECTVELWVVPQISWLLREVRVLARWGNLAAGPRTEPSGCRIGKRAQAVW